MACYTSLMIFTETGRIIGEFYVLGHPSVPVYLLDGENPILFDAGFTGLTDVYLQAIREVLRERTPKFLFLTHAHWDHVGSAGYFKRAWPALQIVASRKTRDLLQKESVRTMITDLNQGALDALRAWGFQHPFQEPFLPFGTDRIVDPPASLSLSADLTVMGMASPGHTRDFTVYWIPEKGLLIASEAAGCDGVPEFIVDYDAYVAGLDVFIRLRPRALCTGHQIVVTGKDVPTYLSRMKETAMAYRRFVEMHLEKGEGIDSIVSRIQAWEWDPKPYPKQPLEAYRINTRRRVETLAERWKKRKAD